ncbi:hypothetical protein AAD018_013660 [Aestuariibius insulae]
MMLILLLAAALAGALIFTAQAGPRQDRLPVRIRKDEDRKRLPHRKK